MSFIKSLFIQNTNSKNSKWRWQLICLYFFIFIFSSVLFAQETDEELTKAAQNPIANLISIPFQNNTYFNFPGARTQDVLNIQPVIPSFNGRLITRTIFPFVWDPDYSNESGSDFGFGNIVFTTFYSPESKESYFGYLPITSLPAWVKSHWSSELGIGSSLFALVMSGQWIIGGLINNI